MLPFARILEYGNIREVMVLKKVVNDGSGVLLLTTDGKLYASGTNNNGKYGSVQTNTTGWTLIYENVDNFFSSPTWTFVKLKNGSYYCTGVTASFGTPSGSVFVDCSTTFAGITGTIKDIQVNVLRNTIGVLTVEGELWFIGTNTQNIFGMASPSSSTVFVKNTVVNDIKSFKMVYANIWALSKSGVLYGSGNPNAGQIPSSTGFVSLATGVLDYAGTVSTILWNTSSGVFGRGNLQSMYGTTVSSSSTPVQCTLPFTYNASTFSFPLMLTNSSGAIPAKIICKNSNNYYVSGSDSYGWSSTKTNGAGGTMSGFTSVLHAPSTDIIFYDGNYCSYYIQNDKLYVSGRLYPLPGHTTSEANYIYTEETIKI